MMAVRVASQDATDGFARPLQDAILSQGIDGILRAGGIVTATAGEQKRKRILIDPDQQNHYRHGGSTNQFIPHGG